MIRAVFTVIWDLAGDKIGKKYRRSENNVNFALTIRVIIYDGTEFKKEMKSILLNNN